MSKPWTEFKDHDYRAFLDLIENGIGGPTAGECEPAEPERISISMNNRAFTPTQFEAMTTRRDGESVRDHAHRVARRLGVGCVTSS